MLCFSVDWYTAVLMSECVDADWLCGVAGDESPTVALQRASSRCGVSSYETRWRQSCFLVTAGHLQTGFYIHYQHNCHHYLIVFQLRGICTIVVLSLSVVPWAQCPLVSVTYFTKWLHFLMSIASPCRVQMSLLHQSTRSSVHLLLGLPLLFFCHPLCRQQLVLGACRLVSCICDRRSSTSSG